MKTFIFGHKRPDTDSVCSAIAYAHLKNVLNVNAEARILGSLNLESKFVLKYFNIPEPRYLNDVKIQIRNMKYLENAYIHIDTTIKEAFETMQNKNVTGLPIVDENNSLQGYINLRDLCRYMSDSNIEWLNTSYDNIIKTLDGKKILSFNNEIKGTIVSSMYNSNNFANSKKLSENNILITDSNIDIIKYAIDSKVKLIIIFGDFKFPAELLVKASLKKVNIITTPNSNYADLARIYLSNYVSNIDYEDNPIYFNTTDYRDDFLSIAEKSGHTNYPVIDKKNKCVGMIRLVDQNTYEKCQCILVDHNQDSQSVDNINEANILEVIDHHNIGVFQSSSPISFRIMPVGCTSTIIYQIYKENNIEIPKNIAGIMLSAILSDTLLLKSPTTTKLDIDTANTLAKIANLNIEEYGLKMFKAGTSIDNMDIQEIFEQDFKTYEVDNYNIGISQVMTLDIDTILKNKDSYINLLNEMNNFNYKITLMFVTDVIKNGSYIFYNDSAKDIIMNAYQLDNLKQGLFLSNVVSRKKQMLPKLLDYLQK
ncbi:MAG: putative manganese-dependent inorganic diphosphatase [Bacilli bacterium]|nr:putative manganese-dependent inorganic diphosphatase [Bacilli bacterium]